MKMRPTRTAALALAGTLSFITLTANAATDYELDTVTGVEFKEHTSPTSTTTITGVPRNTTTPVTIYVAMSYAGENSGMARCLPLLLTMMEKPGRYYLTLTVENDLTTSRCGLRLRS